MATHVYTLVPSYNVAGQFAQNVMHWQFDDGGYGSTVAAANALINAFVSAGLTALRNILPTDVNILSFKSRRVTGGGGFEKVQPSVGSVPGLRSGITSASGIAPCIVFYPVDQVRSRGRLFLPGLSESDASDGVYTSAYKTAVDTNVDTFTDDLTLAGGGAPTAQFVIFNPRSGVARVMSKHLLSDTIGTIRRRQLPV
jgi:hypothetical protein